MIRFGADRGPAVRVVDIPNSCSTVYIPTAIFDIDVRPRPPGRRRSTGGMDAEGRFDASPGGGARSTAGRDASSGAGRVPETSVETRRRRRS